MGQKLLQLIVIVGVCLFMTDAYAKGGGASLGFGLNLTTADQGDMDRLIDAQNVAQGGISTSSFGSALEFSAHWEYRFSGMLALQFRGTYFTQDSTGSGGGLDFDYSVTGFTLFPIMRWYLLESSVLAFYGQVGIGWGFASGDITEGAGQLSYSGNASGFMGGIGAELCFVANHCMAIEGNFRYLPVERTTVDSRNAGALATGTALTQAGDGQELEIGGRDLAVSMGGIQGMIAYIFRF